LLADVRAMALSAGLPAPRLYLIDNSQPNAFAVGRNPANAALVATTGLIGLLSGQEVRAVMGHELAHVRKRDTLAMTVIAAIAGAVIMPANVAAPFGARDGEARTNPIAGVLLMLFAPPAAALVRLAVSRARAYEADRVGAAISGDPTALAHALEKMHDYVRQRPNPDAERNPAAAHLFIVNPLSGDGADKLFSTHPSTRDRVAQLLSLARNSPMPARAPVSSEAPAPAPTETPVKAKAPVQTEAPALRGRHSDPWD
jgi:heat shock protein HtpX